MYVISHFGAISKLYQSEIDSVMYKIERKLCKHDNFRRFGRDRYCVRARARKKTKRADNVKKKEEMRLVPIVIRCG